jgi:hypothetical protein
MKSIRSIGILQFAAAIAGGLLLSACGGADPDPPLAHDLALTTTEDSSASNKLSATTAETEPLVFRIAAQPSHGIVTLNTSTGEFTYEPTPDFAGDDAFVFDASVGKRKSQLATVRVSITPVNDPPVLRAIPVQTNSAESLVVTYALAATDVDGDSLHVTATIDDPSIATVSSSDDGLTLSILPLTRGATSIHVAVRDSEYVAEQSFDFGVGDVTKWRNIPADMANGEAIAFTNTTNAPIRMQFVHNGFPLFQSDDEIVAYVRAQQSQFPGEPFERKLWRFVRDSTYHNVPLTGKQWQHDTWAVLVAQGWGLCSHMSAAYVQLARAAGYEARVWGLTGHVVAEIKIADRWEIYDPDLAQYYFTPDLEIAGVEDIETNPNLLLEPINPVLPLGIYSEEYMSMVAGIYASTDDNFIGDGIFLSEAPRVYEPLVLPPGARFEYPGRWTQSVTGITEGLPVEVPYYLQSRLSTQAGWTGPVVLPWMIWEIRGSGRVRVLGQEFEVESTELQELLKDPGQQIPEIEVLSATTELQFISFINAMRYALNETNSIALTGMDMWGVNVEKSVLPEEFRASATGNVTFKKPAP